jgi:Protein of unknown function (DUF616)/UDP-glucose/GDP-mannose dehydrogenase family, NAD binding domain/UDP-glucose/GDP-mannose dehydrogenase family, UDP binding domain
VNKITVNGLGYVGLPLAIHFATRGFSVIGIDKDKLKIDQLSKGISYIPDVTDTHLQEAVSKGTFTAFTPEEAVPLLKEVSHVMVAVPTPLTELENLDLGDIIDASDRIQKLLQQAFDQIVPVSSLKIAEICKLFEDISSCRKLDIDIYESLQAAGEVLLIGISFKKDVNDLSKSSAIAVFSLPVQEGINVENFDPLFFSFPMKGNTNHPVELADKQIQQEDVVVILTDPSVINWKLVYEEAKNIVDTRRMLCSLGLEEKQMPSFFAESQPNEFVVNKTDEKPRNKINEKPLVIADEKSNSKMRPVVMYTAITNNYDILKEVNYPSPDIDYIAFTDNKDLKSKTWKIIYLENLVMDSHIKTVKYYKMLPHIFLPHYQYSIWIDGSMKIRQDIQPLLEQLYQYPLTVFKHPERNCIYQEMEACRMWNLDNEFTMRKQMDLYRSKGYPKDNGLISSGVLLRQHNHPHVIKVMEDWWEEIFSHSKRDQLSFNFVAWKNGIDYQTLRWQDLINYFRIYPHIGKR